MSKINFDESKAGKFFSGKGFYVVLACCLVAVGAAAWTAIRTVAPPPVDFAELSSSPIASMTSSNTANVGKTVSGEEDTRTTSKPQSSSKPASSSVTETAAKPEATFFVMPITGDIIKKFDDKELQYSETYGDMRVHYGVDIAGDKGSKVKSAGDGTVTDVYADPLWGTTVVIDHGNNIVAYYSGLNKKPSVNKGDVVAPGTILGDISEIPCEIADAPHLHLGIKQGDVWVSPLKLMGMEEPAD